MESINKFIGGVKKFKDFALYKNSEWTFPSLNIRITNTGDEGFMIVPLNSNEEIFHIKPNYVIIGAEEYNGYVYIISALKDNSGISEIGIFPSPKNWNTNNNDYEKTYKPLHNLDLGSGVVDFNTALLNYDSYHEVELVIKEINDGSVNLYITDFNNHDRVINTGLKYETGSLTGNVVTTSMFGGALDLFSNSNKFLKVSYVGLTENGNNKPGNYELYFRYVTYDFSRTKFIEIVYPIVVGEIGNRKHDLGLAEINIDNIMNRVGSSINLDVDVSSIDDAFKYIEIAVLRHSASENGAPITDSYLINKLYSTADISSNNRIVISGLEDVVSLSVEEVMFSLPSSNINKSHTVVKSRYFGANWKGFQYDKDSLKKYAENISVRYALGNIINDEEKYQNAGMSFDNAQYKINELGVGKNTYDFSQYYRGEIVPFGIIFIIEGGYETEVFPINGGDEYNIVGYFDELSTYGEAKGLYRFPFIDSDNATRDANSCNIQYPMGVKFNNTNAITYLSDPNYDFTGVIGFYYVRGNKVKNLLYQGLLSGIADNYYSAATTAKTMIPVLDSEYEIGVPTTVIKTKNNVLPITKLEHDSSDNVSRVVRTHYPAQLDKESYSLISIDNLFSILPKITDNASIYVKKLFDVTIPRIVIAGSYFPEMTYMDINEQYSGSTKTFPTPSNSFISAIINSIENGDYEKVNVSAFVKDGALKENHFYYYNNGNTGTAHHIYYNRSYDFCKYLLLKVNSSDWSIDFLNSIVNIYLHENTYDSTGATGFYKMIYNGFNSSSELYWRISDKYILADNTSSNIIFKGDVMVHRAVVRAVHAFGMDTYNDGGTSPLVAGKYGYGQMLSLLTENSQNIAARNNVAAFDPDNVSSKFLYSYYPNILLNGYTLEEWLGAVTTKENLYEALQINDGYNYIEAFQKRVGIDMLRSPEELSYKTRIYFSEKAISNELSDSYRRISEIAYQDFSLEYGQIIRILNYNEILISIQESSINVHYLGQKKMTAENTSSDIVFNNTGVFLSDEFKQLAKFGSQHQKSIIITEKAVYGVDVKNRLLIWRLYTSVSSTGRSIPTAIDIATKLEIRGWLDELIEDNNLDDIINSLDDNPINGIGVVSGYNKAYKEVYFTFHIKKHLFSLEEALVGDSKYYNSSTSYDLYETFYYNGNWYYVLIAGTISISQIPEKAKQINREDIIMFYAGMSVAGYSVIYDIANNLAYFATVSYASINYITDLVTFSSSRVINDVYVDYEAPIQRTLLYSELINQFICEVSFYPGFYSSLKNKMLISKISEELNSNKVYQSDKKNDYLSFFDIDEEMAVSVIVNGSDQKASAIIKFFGNYRIASNNEELYKIEFYTQQMSSEIDPFIPTDWNLEYVTPEYKEDSWYGAIPNDITVDKFGTEEFLKGSWLKIVIRFKKNSYFYIREIITNYNKSFI